jgi:hypothetical protein
MTDHDGTVQPELRDESRDVRSGVVKTVAVFRAVAWTMAALVDGDDVKARQQVRRRQVPDPRRGAQPVQQQDRYALTTPVKAMQPQAAAGKFNEALARSGQGATLSSAPGR